MISETKARKYCCEDISTIENYEQAINDQTQMWECHHRWETDRGLSREELIFCCEYDYVPADRLIFLTKAQHQRLHNLGKKMAESTKRKLSKLCSGWHHTEEAKERIGAAFRKVVLQYSKSGELVAEYESTVAAAKATGAAHVGTVCNGKRKTSGGYVWRYKE